MNATGKIQSFRDLIAWKKSVALCSRVYEATKTFPSDEKFGLTSQLQRASVSVPSNIAEGYARDTTRDYIKFLWIAHGSLAEVETQLVVATNLNYLRPETYEGLLADVHEIGRVLRALIRSLGGSHVRNASTPIQQSSNPSSLPAGATPSPPAGENR
ncbi:MAG: four helix bundle protein [Phycisphaerae bacterium]